MRRIVLGIGAACLVAAGCAQIFGIDPPNEVPAPTDGAADGTTGPDGPSADAGPDGADATGGDGGGDASVDATPEAQPEAATDADAGIDSPPSGPIVGQQSHYFLPDNVNSANELPVDFTMVPIAARVLGSDGGVTVYDGGGNGAGQFTIDNVPPGAEFYVEATGLVVGGGTIPLYVFDTQRTLDLSDVFLGLNTGQGGDGTGTVQLNVSGAVPFGPNDAVNLQALNAPYTEYSYGATPAPTVGASAYTTSWATDPVQGLVQPSDTVWVVQMHSSSSDAAAPQALTTYAAVTGVTTANGETTVLDAGLAAAPQTSVSLQIDEGAFTQYVDDITPNGVIEGSGFVIDAYPTGQIVGLGMTYNGTVDMLNVSQGTTGGVTTYDASYGDPFPAGWSRVITIGIQVEDQVVAPLPDGGVSNPGDTPGAISCTLPLAPYAAGMPVAPLVSPVQQPVVNQGSFRNNRTGVGLQPTVGWTAPALGPPTVYIVQVRLVQLNAANQPQMTRIALLSTASTSVTVPPGILQSGQLYQFDIVALSSHGDDATRPFYQHLPFCAASTLSGVMAP